MSPFYHLLICLVDGVSRLPRGSCPPDATRLYRENLALKVRLEALAADILLLRAYVFAEVKRFQEASLATPTTVRAASPCRTHFRS